MPRDLDDWELERTPQAPERAAGSGATGRPTRTGRPRVPPSETVDLEVAEDSAVTLGDDPRAPGASQDVPARGSRLFPVALAGVAVLAFVALAGIYFAFRPTPRTPPTAGALPAPAATPLPTPLPNPGQKPAEGGGAPVELPPLGQSDEFVRLAAAGLSAHPELTRWLAQASLVPTLAAVVTNIAAGESPRPHLGFLKPRTGFEARRRGARLTTDPSSFTGYDRFAEAVATIDASVAVAAYRTLQPLFEASYRDLGQPDGSFDNALERAIGTLLATPDVPDQTPLEPHATLFRYADPRLERLNAAQKQFLRLGPRNVKAVQAKLVEIREALARSAPPATTAP